MEVRALAQQLLSELGFAVPRPPRFSIREALRECEKIRSRLDLADSIDAVRGSFFAGCNLIERVMRYASFAWSHLAYEDDWNGPLGEIITASSRDHSYPGPDRLSFGQYKLLFVTLPKTFVDSNSAREGSLFAKIFRAMRQAKVADKLSALVALRNKIEHDDEDTVSLSLSQLRQRSSSALAEAYTALDNVYNRQLLPLTVRPQEERRDPYGRRVLRLLDPDDVTIEAYCQG